MVSTIAVAFDHIDKQSRKIIRIGWRSDLVIHHFHRAIFTPEAEHGLDEIIAIDSKYPGNADNKIFFHILFECQFSVILALSVGIEWRSLIIRLPWSLAVAGKDVIGTQIKHFAIQFFTYFSNILCAVHIDSATDFDVFFCAVDGGIGTAVNDCIRLHFCHDTFYGCRIGNIHLVDIHADCLMSAFLQFTHNIVA